MEKIGLIAGRGSFPLLFAQEAVKKGFSVIAVGIRGETRSSLKDFTEKIHWINVWEFNALFDIFKSDGVKQIAMAGQVHPRHLFDKKVIENPLVKDLFSKIKDRKTDTIFSAVAGELESSGFEIMDSTCFLKDYLPRKGVLTSRQPSFLEWEDIYFGLAMAKYIAAVDIGQTVAVKNKAVVAVESLEGTDSTIRRAGILSRGGAVIVKVSKPKQDMRFDIPVIGARTIKNLIRSRARCLAIEAEKTLLLDRDVTLRLANSKNICIVCV